MTQYSNMTKINHILYLILQIVQLINYSLHFGNVGQNSGKYNTIWTLLLFLWIQQHFKISSTICYYHNSPRETPKSQT